MSRSRPRARPSPKLPAPAPAASPATGPAAGWRRAGPAAIGLAATAAVLLTLAPEAGGPGVTCDELYHVSYGKRLVGALADRGLRFFSRESVAECFAFGPDGPPVHPPLGHWVLGAVHRLFDPAPDNRLVVSIAAARFAPALAFGALVGMVGLWTARREGTCAGCAAGAAVALIPRVFGHAHLAALDTLTCLTFLGAVLAAAEAHRSGRRWCWACAGAVWGLALLTRIHGLLVLPPVAAWLVWQRGWRAAGPVAVWTGAGAAVFFAGWPWLWYSTWDRLQLYLASATARQPIHVYYLGQTWPDRDAPWHYAPVMFLATVPAGLLVLGLLGLWSKRRAWRAEPHWVLVPGTLVWVLGVFAWPGTPVYDGVRLFLMVFPLWAVAAGAGAAWTAGRLSRWRPRPPWIADAAVAGLVAVQGAGIVLHHPCPLSHYSLLVGGLTGAERLGFEVTYWGDTVREPLLAEAARRSPGRPVLFAPHLAPFQAPAVAVSSPALARSETPLIGWDAGRAGEAAECRLIVVYSRKADLAAVEPLLRDARILAEYRQQGVWLARLMELSAPVGRLVH